MKLKDSIIYSFSQSNNKKFDFGKSILEIFAFLQGVMVGERKFIKFDSICDGTWIVQFEEFATDYLNSEINGFKNDWIETIGTTYAKWIYQNQKNDEDGLEKFYMILDLFIESINEEK